VVLWQAHRGIPCGLYEVVVSPRSVVQPIRPCHLCWRGAYVWGTLRLPRGIGGVRAKQMETFLGQTWSQDGIVLTLWPRVVKSMELEAPESLRLVGMQA
jgi:hypothetical protein